MRAGQAQFMDFAYVQMMKDEGLGELIGKDRAAVILHEQGWTWVVQALRAELNALIATAAFGVFHPHSETDELGTLNSFKGAAAVITSKAPRWLDLIQRACCDVHRDESIYSQRAIPAGRQLTILSLLCHMLRPNTSTNFQSIMGLYIYQGGARRRVLDTLCQLGLTMS